MVFCGILGDKCELVLVVLGWLGNLGLEEDVV